MLSFRVNALLHTGQCTLFSPVCFLPCRAAWPEVVNVAEHAWLAAYGHGYLFFRGPFEAWSLDPPSEVCGDGGSGAEAKLRRLSDDGKVADGG